MVLGFVIPNDVSIGISLVLGSVEKILLPVVSAIFLLITTKHHVIYVKKCPVQNSRLILDKRWTLLMTVDLNSTTNENSTWAPVQNVSNSHKKSGESPGIKYGPTKIAMERSTTRSSFLSCSFYSVNMTCKRNAVPSVF